MFFNDDDDWDLDDQVDLTDKGHDADVDDDDDDDWDLDDQVDLTDKND